LADSLVGITLRERESRPWLARSEGISIQRKRSDMKEEIVVKEQRPEPRKEPFFARFLEPQEALEVQTGVKAGRTLKYPSDTDEWDDL